MWSHAIARKSRTAVACLPSNHRRFRSCCQEEFVTVATTPQQHPGCGSQRTIITTTFLHHDCGSSVRFSGVSSGIQKPSVHHPKDPDNNVCIIRSATALCLNAGETDSERQGGGGRRGFRTVKHIPRREGAYRRLLVPSQLNLLDRPVPSIPYGWLSYHQSLCRYGAQASISSSSGNARPDPSNPTQDQSSSNSAAAAVESVYAEIADSADPNPKKSTANAPGAPTAPPEATAAKQRADPAALLSSLLPPPSQAPPLRHPVPATTTVGPSPTPPLSSSSPRIAPTAPSSNHRKRRRIVLPRDPDQDLINENRTRQRRHKEESRSQTASNVYRALVGNVLICGAKLAAWLSSGSSGLMAEFIHSVVDCGNQALLLVGLRSANLAADRSHPYGYGKSVYFWALVSALGTFFLGAGVSMSHALQHLAHPSLQEITPEVWGVLLFSFVVDGYVLNKTIRESLADKPSGASWFGHLMSIRDPATLAILLEDGAACLGVVMALGGIVASNYTANPMYDAVAGVGISALLGAMGLTLVRVNHRFLLGQGVDREITDDIGRILLSRRSIDSIGSVQSQWTGPETFSYKAEVDFDGTFLAAKLLPIYQQEFLQIRDTMDDELQVLLALYTEDVMRTVEREVRHVEALIRKRHPGAEYIELEPMSVHADLLAINDNLEDELRRVESDALDRYLRTLKKEGGAVAEESQPSVRNDAGSDPLK